MARHEPMDVEASFDDTEIAALAARIKEVLDIRDRRYGFPPRTYERCFVGQEAVATLVDENIASDVEDAVRIGNMLLNAGVFHHVQQAHPFKNAYLFYRFAADEDHGAVARTPDGNVVSWADFLAPLASDDAATLSLLPTMPERDPSLAQFAQDDLDTCGVSPLDVHNVKLLDNTHPPSVSLDR